MSNVKSSHWGQKNYPALQTFSRCFQSCGMMITRYQAVEGTMDFTSPGHLRKRAVPKLGQIWRCGESSNFEISIFGIQYTRCKDSCGMDFTRMTIPFLHHVLSMAHLGFDGETMGVTDHLIFPISPMKRVIDWGSIPQFSDKSTSQKVHYIISIISH